MSDWYPVLRIFLGLIVAVAALVWAGFWLLAAFWEWPYFGANLGSWLVFAALFGLAIVAFFGGVFLAAGHAPGLRGWAVVGVLAVCPTIPIVHTGRAEQDHLAAVEARASSAYAARSGAHGVEASCVWEGDRPRYESWNCGFDEVGSGGTSCEVVYRPVGGGIATIHSCETDDEQASTLVARTFRSRFSRAPGEVECHRISIAATFERWGCDVGDFPAPTTCRATVRRSGRGHVVAEVIRCESTRRVGRAFARAYERRTGALAPGTACYREWSHIVQSWSCDMGRGTREDHCEGTLVRQAGRIAARIAWCANDPD